MPGKRSRDKGSRGEREAALALQNIGILAERNGRNGYSADDLRLPAVLGALHIEVKYSASPSPATALAQAEDHRQKCQYSVAMTKRVVAPAQGRTPVAHPWLWTIRVEDLEAVCRAVCDHFDQQRRLNKQAMDQSIP